MKWIKDLPDDFTQDFQFGVIGHVDPRAWLKENLKVEKADLDCPITITRDEILQNKLIRESILLDDIGDQAISWTYSNGHVLDDDIQTTGCCIVGDEMRRISMARQNIISVPDLSELTTLISLELSNCPLSDVSNVARLTNLKTLDLSWCAALSDLSALGTMTALSALKLSDCGALSDVSGLAGMNNLVSLDLSWCTALTDTSGLLDMTSLTSLDLSGCDNLTDISGLLDMTSLTSLNLFGCDNLTDLSALESLSGLTRLDIRIESLEDIFFLARLSRLEYLDLTGCKAIKNLSVLAELTSLTTLMLYECSSQDFSFLKGLKSLTTLELTGGKSFTDLSDLVGLTSLSWLSLPESKFLKDVSGLEYLTSLTFLRMTNCNSLEQLPRLSKLVNLTSLDLRACTALRDLSGLRGLTSLTSLELNRCKSLQDLSGLEDLTGLTTLDFQECSALHDVSGIAGLKNLLSLNFDDCPNVDHETNRESIGTLDNLQKLHGIAEPWRTQILWNAALRRGDQAALNDKLERMLDVCASKMSSPSLRSDFLASLSLARISDEQMKQVHGMAWSREEWCQLLLSTDNRLDPVGSEPKYGIHDGSIVFDTCHTFFRDSGESPINGGWRGVGIRDAMKGYILAVAEGARWEGAHEVIAIAADQALLELDKSNGIEAHPSWDESLVDLLLALQHMSLNKQHDDLLRAVSDANRQTFDLRLRVAATEVELEKGRWGIALQHMEGLPSSLESELMSKIIPKMVGDEVPDAVLKWMEEAADQDLEFLINGTPLSPAEGLKNRGIRETLFWLHTGGRRSGILKLVRTFFEHFPDDPWVLALHAECMRSVNEKEKESSLAGGLKKSLQSEAILTQLGPMVSQQLTSTLEGKTDTELHQLAVALLLEHFGAVTPQYREAILKALKDQ